LPDALVKASHALEAATGKEVWLLVEGDFMINYGMYLAFRDAKADIAGKEIALVLDSGGGKTDAAYRIARLFQRKAKSFTVVVPRFAKSAATLLSLGAEEIILGEDADLGPLDAQIMDYDHEETWVSALDTVQAVEQLEDSAIEVASRMLKYLQLHTKKRYSMLLEPSLHFAATVTRGSFKTDLITEQVGKQIAYRGR